MFGSSFCLLTEKVTDEEAQKKNVPVNAFVFFVVSLKKDKVTNEEEKKKKEVKLTSSSFHKIDSCR